MTSPAQSPPPPPRPPTVAIVADPPQDPHLAHRARCLSQQLHLPLLPDPTAAPHTESEILLAVTPHRFELRWFDQKRPRPISVELPPHHHRVPQPITRNQPLAKALAIKSDPHTLTPVIDATAGLGDDTWLLASLGCAVTALERSPILAALLSDGLDRARPTAPSIAQRITIIPADAIPWLNNLAAQTPQDNLPHVVYLDPMFPPKRKSALQPRPLRLLRRLLGDDPDAAELFAAALRAARKRVVVKRPFHAPPLAPDPTSSHTGKTIRYDVYVPGVYRPG